MPLTSEIVPIRSQHTHGVYSTKLYKGQKHNGIRSDYDEVIVFAPGWLGSGTLHFAASVLAHQGHDVAVVGHEHTSLFHPNQDRSKHVHWAARAASQATGKRGVILLGHSNGNQDVHNAAEDALQRQANGLETDKRYEIRAIGALAGAGLSGRSINIHEALPEAYGIMHEFLDHPIAELDVVARSVLTMLRHPLLSTVEGIGAAFCDVRKSAENSINRGGIRAYVETYFDNDNVIPLPGDRTDYTMRPGWHLTPVVSSEAILDVAERLYEDNHPKELQIASWIKR